MKAVVAILLFALLLFWYCACRIAAREDERSGWK